MINEGGNRCDAVANVLDSDILVSEFELQSRYYVHFRTNTLGQSWNLPILPSYGLDNTTTTLLN